jgi:hypothetical protein
VKEYEYSPASWVIYLKDAKEFFKRELTQKEYRALMNLYINGKPYKEL